MADHPADNDEAPPTIRSPGHAADNRLLNRESPTDQSESGLPSRAWRPQTGGPQLVTTWSLGPAPAQFRSKEKWAWTIPEGEFLLKHAMVSLPYGAAIDHAPSYVSALGRGFVEAGTMLRLTLSCEHLEGDAYEETITVPTETNAPFVLPMLEFTPEVEAYVDWGRICGEAKLFASVQGGPVTIERGTCIQLWSE